MQPNLWIDEDFLSSRDAFHDQLELCRQLIAGRLAGRIGAGGGGDGQRDADLQPATAEQPS